MHNLVIKSNCQVEWITNMTADAAVNEHYLPAEIYVKYWEIRDSGRPGFDLVL